MEFSGNTKTEKQIRKFTFGMVVFFLMLVIGMAGILSYVITRKSSQDIQNKVVNLLDTSNRQQIYNVDLYLKKVEETAALFFSDDKYCTYDATSSRLTDFEKIQNETAIQNRIQDLSILDNFSDFGIVYKDDSMVGWLSNTTQQLFPDGGLYQYMSQHIHDTKTESGWFFDYARCLDRLYYVKRLNPHAILVTAFYSRELSQSFSVSESIDSQKVYLLDSSQTILYADTKESIGKKAASVIDEYRDRYRDYQSIGDKNVIVSGTCENNWIVVCAVPTRSLFQEEYSFQRFAILVTGILVCVILLCGCSVLLFISRSSSGVLSDITRKADYDALTHCMNKASYREFVHNRLMQPKDGTWQILVMLDMDNFKQVNDTLGHQEGDEVLQKASAIFNTLDPKRVAVGRLGGDEFSLFAVLNAPSEQKAREEMEQIMEQLFGRFANELGQGYAACQLALSAGICIMKGDAYPDYEEMYQKADRALYESKRTGKNRYNWYKQ